MGFSQITCKKYPIKQIEQQGGNKFRPVFSVINCEFTNRGEYFVIFYNQIKFLCRTKYAKLAKAQAPIAPRYGLNGNTSI